MTLPLAGAKIRAADLAEAFPLDIGAWTSFTPTLTQGATVSKTVTNGAYTKIGRTVIGVVSLSITSAGTAGQILRVGLPVASASASGAVGSAWFFDASTNTRYVLSGARATVNDVWFLHDTSAANLFGAVPAVTLANGDLFDFHFSYEAAS